MSIDGKKEELKKTNWVSRPRDYGTTESEWEKTTAKREARHTHTHTHTNKKSNQIKTQQQPGKNAGENSGENKVHCGPSGWNWVKKNEKRREEKTKHKTVKEQQPRLPLRNKIEETCWRFVDVWVFGGKKKVGGRDFYQSVPKRGGGSKLEQMKNQVKFCEYLFHERGLTQVSKSKRKLGWKKNAFFFFYQRGDTVIGQQPTQTSLATGTTEKNPVKISMKEDSIYVSKGIKGGGGPQ